MKQVAIPTAARPGPPGALQVTELGRDGGCGRSVNWRCDLMPGFEPKSLERRFVEAGYHSRSRHPALMVFRHPEGHELAWVVTTGRVQIRVAPVVEAARRKTVAHGIYGELLECLQGC